jgi:hypothetical protein
VVEVRSAASGSPGAVKAALRVAGVTRFDRVARSTRDLLNTLAAITAKKAGFK